MDTWDIKIENIHAICRICLDECKSMSNVYQNDNIHQMSIVEVLKNCMSLKIEEDEELPSLVCGQCEAEILHIYEFRLKFDRSSRYLQEYLINLEHENIHREEMILVDTIKKDDVEAENSFSIVQYPQEALDDVKISVDHQHDGLESQEESISDNETQDDAENDVTAPLKPNNDDLSGLTLYKCKKCQECFSSKAKLMDHRRQLLHYTRKTVTCSHCALLVPIQNYKSHFLKHSSDFSCEFCGKRFSNNFNLKRHLFIHTNQTPYSCDLCNAKFARQDKLKAHSVIHTCEKQFTCDTCGQQFRHQDKLKQHQERAAPCNGDSDYNSEKYKRTLSCDVCFKSFALLSSLRTHKLLHTDDRVICSVCGKLYPNEKKLKEHKLQVHSRKAVQGKEFLCNICAKQYSNKAILQRHILSHLGLAKSYNCKICNKSFTQSGSLSLHLKIHSGEKPFVCHVCSRAFNKPSNLQRHLKSHNNVRPYVCAICEKCFSVKHSLIVHTRIHTGEKPYICTVCGKKFVDRGSMTKHFKIHNGQSLNCEVSQEKLVDL